MTLAELLSKLEEAQLRLPDFNPEDIRVRVMDADNGYCYDLNLGGLQTESSPDTAIIWLTVSEA